MYGRVCGVTVAVIVVFSLLCQPAQAQVQRGCYAEFFDDDGNTLKVLGEGKPDGFWKASCHDDECRAIKDIGCAVDAQAHRMVPNTMAYLSYRAFLRAKAQYGQNIKALGREHPERIPLYCTLLARVAATITGDKAHDGKTAENIVELAILVDRPHHHCLAGVVAVMPKEVKDSSLAWGQNCLHKIKACQEDIVQSYTP